MTAESPADVLVVEDSATQAEEIRLILESAGFAVQTVSNAEAALAELTQSTFDFVISDIVMPGMSGYELCRHIKGDSRWKTIPVLLLTSLTDPIDVIHALESGADSFLSKPCEPDHLITRVRSLLESRRLRAEARGASGTDILFNGQHFTIPSDKEQILDLLVSTFEDMVRKNQEVLAARDALAAKHEQLLRLEQQKDELSALIVHDLKSPAAGIMMAAQACLKKSNLPESERELWRLIHTSAEVINRMVLNLLDISASSDGVFALRPAVVDIAKLVDDVQQLMTPVAESLRHQISTHTASELPQLHADPELLRRVLQNLVENALRHSAPGEPVQLDADVIDRFVRFRVRDCGPGIPPALRERVFDKYVRVDKSHSGESVGKGLGLAFCRIAVEAHGGRIWVDDNQPKGSVFTFQIPIGVGRPQAETRAPS
jgi:signal transduction histidine kinase